MNYREHKDGFTSRTRRYCLLKSPINVTVIMHVMTGISPEVAACMAVWMCIVFLCVQMCVDLSIQFICVFYFTALYEHSLFTSIINLKLWISILIWYFHNLPLNAWYPLISMFSIPMPISTHSIDCNYALVQSTTCIYCMMRLLELSLHSSIKKYHIICIAEENNM